MEFDHYDVVKALDFERLGGSSGERRAIDVLTSYIDEAGLPYTIHPVKRAIDTSHKEKIEKYLWQSLREKPELKWKEAYKR